METIEFKKLLFRSAVCVMACDGEIHDDEIKEIELIVKKTQYFKDLDCDFELKTILDDIKNNGKQVIENYLNTLTAKGLNSVQELLLLEVIMRIISADKKVDADEIKFLHLVKSRLKVHDELIVERFGSVEYLFDTRYKNISEERRKDLINDMKLPKLRDLQDVNIEKKDELNET